MRRLLIPLLVLTACSAPPAATPECKCLCEAAPAPAPLACPAQVACPAPAPPPPQTATVVIEVVGDDDADIRVNDHSVGKGVVAYEGPAGDTVALTVQPTRGPAINESLALDRAHPLHKVQLPRKAGPDRSRGTF